MARARPTPGPAGAAWVLIALALASPARAGTAALAYTDVAVAVGARRYPARVPRGWSLALRTDRLSGPRMLAFGPDRDLFVGSRSGAVYRLRPPYRDPEVLVRLGDYPHSVAFRDGEILIARTGGLYRAPYAPGQARIAPASVTLLAALPGGGGHDSRTVRVGPDRRVYVSLGIQGNCSDQYLADPASPDDRRGGVLVLDESGARPRWRAFASGLRNPVGFDWQPGTGAMYASNNGPDHLGFDQPPEYFTRLAPGSFHGMPWFQWDGHAFERDSCVASDPPRPLSDVPPPDATLPARSAPLGVAFVPPGALVPAVVGDAAVAVHGSWGTAPDGGAGGDPATRRAPRIALVRFADGTARRVDDLVTGFQAADGRRWARPAGVAIGPDGALYFTSDRGVEGLFRLAPPRVP